MSIPQECPDSENGQGNNVGANRRRRDVTDEDELFEEMMTTVFINSPFDRHSSCKYWYSLTYRLTLYL